VLPTWYCKSIAGLSCGGGVSQLAEGTKVNFERVLLVKDGEKLSIGQPYVQGTFAFAFPPSSLRPAPQRRATLASMCDAHAMPRVWLGCTGASVQATVLEAYRGKKQIVFKMKSKKHYRRKNGHRQELTKFLVTDVTM